jgi:hypothetical protein
VKFRLLVPVAFLALVTGCGPVAQPSPESSPSPTASATSQSAVQPGAESATTPAPAVTTPAAPPTTAAADPGSAAGSGTGSGSGGGAGSGSGSGSGGSCTGDYYRNSSGACVHRPVQAPAPPAGATAECNDGTYSFSQHRSGTCSHHRGVKRWL